MRLLPLFCLLAAFPLAAADLTGTWAGSIERVGGPMGGVKADEHFLVLKQGGGAVTGTAGPKREVQWEITNVTLDGNKVSFEAAAPGSAKLLFVYALELAGDELTGTMELKPPKGVSWKVRVKREQ